MDNNPVVSVRLSKKLFYSLLLALFKFLIGYIVKTLLIKLSKIIRVSFPGNPGKIKCIKR